MNIKNLAKSILMIWAIVAISVQADASQIKQMVIDKSNGSYALINPDFVLARSLAATTAESITVPTGPDGKSKASYVSFSSTCDFYANYSQTATVPGDTTDGTASELNPMVRYLSGGVTTISVITAASSCIITASFYM